MIVAIGMDPGPRPGLVALTYSEGILVGVKVVQCSANMAVDLLRWWVHNEYVRGILGHVEVYFGVERYVDRQTGRSSRAGNITKDMVGEAVQACTGRAFVALNNASRVKTWATDGRLLAAGLMEPTRGMPHARDAARHALFTAVLEGKIPDPYSKRARRTDG